MSGATPASAARGWRLARLSAPGLWLSALSGQPHLDHGRGVELALVVQAA
jgi:hypothetical protein